MSLTDDELLVELQVDNPYRFARWIDGPEAGDDRRWASLAKFLYTVAIVTGTRKGLLYGYDERWCYSDANAALVGLLGWMEAAWVGEPDGWHRHPDSGRRRNPATHQEWIQP
jgi:hypothetical protein